ncbi:MAG: DUF1684 domain-containing protein, partial [Candidatus Limnocylindrales bacterium]
MSDPGTTAAADRGWLADWRRRIGALYVEVRSIAATDPAAAWATWRAEREALYRGHPQSPVPATERATFRAHHWLYDDRLRFSPVPEPPAPAGASPFGPGLAAVALPDSGADTLAFDRVGVVRLRLPAGEATLPVFWMRGYAGGLFLPFGDATNGAETYGAGRYVLDTAKSADLGGGDRAARSVRYRALPLVRGWRRRG